MINRNLSVHLQHFPSVEGFVSEKYPQNLLIEEMDLIREICSTALAIRDQKNLRVRLPLKSITIIGKNNKNLSRYSEIIADEINVKEVLFEEEIVNIASLKLQLNFKKIGAKFKDKIKEITLNAKNDNWQQISPNSIKIANEILQDDDFEIKLSINEYNQKLFAILPLSNNNCLIKLNIETSPELINEGLARDFVRIMQQNRKEANLNITQKIKVFSLIENEEHYSQINLVLNSFKNYIQDQILANKILLFSQEDIFNKEINQINSSKLSPIFNCKFEDFSLKIIIANE